MNKSPANISSFLANKQIITNLNVTNNKVLYKISNFE